MIRPATALSTGYVVVVAVPSTLVLMALAGEVATDDDDDDVVLMVNKDKIFASALDVAKLERRKYPPLVRFVTTVNACAHTCLEFTLTTSSGTKETCKEPARVSSRDVDASWTPAALTSA